MHIAAKWSQTITDTRKLGLALALVGAAGLTAASGSSAQAGDFFHECRSAGGGFVMNDEVLQAFDSEKGKTIGSKIKYKVLDKVELSKRAGFCVAKKAPKGQRRFKFEATTYALRVSFKSDGEPVETFMMCEMASSGLPANYDCDKEVQTVDWVYGQKKLASNDDREEAETRDDRGERTNELPRLKEPEQRDQRVMWMHGGSEVRIEAKGRNRRVIYDAPSKKMRGRGIKVGDVVFEGKREGNKYIGKAFVLSKFCDPVAYDVKGSIKKGESVVVIVGRRPRINKRCQIKSWRDDARIVLKRQQ